MKILKSLFISFFIISFFVFLFLIPATLLHEFIHKQDFSDIEIGKGNICLFFCGKESIAYYTLDYNETIYSNEYIHQREIKSEIKAYSVSFFIILLGGLIGFFICLKYLNK